MDSHGERDLKRFALICPVCGQALQADSNAMRCTSGHSFDLSRKGAVNLLLSSGKGKRHGDDREMVRARTSFLSHGYYDPLSAAAAEMLTPLLKNEAVVVDAGCGEGKYDEDLLRFSENSGKHIRILGIDISKEAVSALRSRTREVSGIVASTAAMPLASECADAVLNIFSPLFAGEFARVLKKNGLLLRVIPLENHLLELKRAVYETAYANPTETVEIDGFDPVGRKEISYSIKMEKAEDIRDLFRMTPYYYKTGKDDQRKLESIKALDVTFSFGILLYRKTERGKA